ncbi:hypothetical protein THIOSC15_3230004 [uncultured Thiomicrorhabdus sp.]
MKKRHVFSKFWGRKWCFKLNPAAMLKKAHGPAVGRADALHRGWKVAMNLLEYLCGVATHTAQMVAEVKAVSDIPLLVTRKHIRE